MEKHEAQAAYEVLHAALNERQWRVYVAVEAKQVERGGISAVARDAQVARGTIRKGIAEIEGGAAYLVGDRIRRCGGGRKAVRSQDPRLVADLEALLEPKGDPLRLLKWTTTRSSHLHQALHAPGHRLAETTIRRLLPAHDYTLQVTRKAHEGASAPDRDDQCTPSKEVCYA